MNTPFEFSADYSGTPVILKVFDLTDNLVLAGWGGGSVGDAMLEFGLGLPDAFDLLGLSVTVDKACKVEFGLAAYTQSPPTFVPLYTTQSTQAVGGGIVRDFPTRDARVNQDNDIRFAAFRITPAANPVTVSVCGDIDVRPVLT